MGSANIRTAWSMGANTKTVVAKHALKNAMIPAITVIGLLIGLLIGTLLGGTVLVEQIFSIPGMGTYLIQAIPSFNLPVIQGVDEGRLVSLIGSRPSSALEHDRWIGHWDRRSASSSDS